MNKFIACFLLSSMLSCSSSFAQSTDEKEVADRVENLRKAMIAADKAVLIKLTAEELSYGHSSGLVEDKAAFVDALVKGKSAFKSIILTDQTIKIAGDVAIVRHHFTGETNNNNVPGKIDLFVLLIWQKQNSEWKLLARQAVKTPAPSN